jgi:hypothetical protein
MMGWGAQYWYLEPGTPVLLRIENIVLRVLVCRDIPL